MRRIRIHLAFGKALITVESKDTVRFAELPLCHLHLFPGTVGITVKGGDVILLLGLEIVHRIVHHIAHGLILILAP